MMINIRKAEIFEGKMPQPLHRFVGGELASLHVVEELLEGGGVHLKPVSGLEFQVASRMEKPVIG